MSIRNGCTEGWTGRNLTTSILCLTCRTLTARISTEFTKLGTYPDLECAVMDVRNFVPSKNCFSNLSVSTDKLHHLFHFYKVQLRDYKRSINM